MTLSRAFLGTLFLFSALAHGETISGRAVAVADGDTLTVLQDHEQFKIRVSGIDAPEKKQAFGSRSKKGLSDCAFGKEVVVEWRKRDKYGRVVGKVFADGADCGLEQIKSGLAWHYKKFEKEQLPEDRTSYARAETEARVSSIGLWAEPDPIPPWEWRASNTTASEIAMEHEWEIEKTIEGKRREGKSGAI